MTDKPTQKDLEIVRIVLKDCSFETPMGQTVFTRKWHPEYKINLALLSQDLPDDLYEVVVTATVTAELAGEVAYLIEAQQAGVFKVVDMESEPRRRLLAIEAPGLIFPYLRAAVDSVASKGGFPVVGLPVPDFESWFENSDPPATLSAGGPAVDNSGST